MSEQAAGQFVWQELMTDDVEAAKRFYGSVVGWGTMPFGDGEPPYTLWTAEDVPVGGLMTTPAEAAGSPPLWFQYISTPDVDAAADRVTSLGGTVHVPPRDIPGVGRFAVVADPQGATFSLFRSIPTDQPPGRPQFGTFAWLELPTTDPEGAFAFYSQLVGWQKADSMDMGDQGTYQMFGTGGAPIGGIFRKSPEQPGPPVWIAYATVRDIDRSARAITDGGGVILYGPTEVPGGGRALAALDPSRAVFGLFSPQPG